MKNIFLHIFKVLPWVIRDGVMYRYVFGRWPKIAKPEMFTEKLLKRKRTQCKENILYGILADKYLVRGYVSNLIGSDNLVPLYENYHSLDEFKKDIYYYNNVVIKTNHASGGVIYVDDYLKESEAQLILKRIRKLLKTDFSKVACEYHYRNIKRCVVVEKRIGGSNNEPVDYKFHIFKRRDGISFVLHIVDKSKGGNGVFTTYVDSFDKPYKGEYIINAYDLPIVKEAKEKSIKLMYSLEYARIDWFIHDGKLYFSEITLTPAAGFLTGIGYSLDKQMGQYWDFPKSI
ncbi:ATP-grasp fold amidoligase family protein [Klebsiella pneumoniae]